MAHGHNTSGQGDDPADDACPRSRIETVAAEWFARRDMGLDAEQRDALQRWLSADPRHAEAFSQLEAAWSTFGKPTRAGEADTLLAELEARRARRGRRRAIMATAVLAIAAVGFGVARWRTDGIPGPAHVVAVLHNPIHRQLPDGSTVTLREGAGITVAFADSQRRIVLQHGEALFEVAKDPLRPFVVSVDGVEVRALGTAFSVYAAGGSVTVLVTEGTVSVEPAGHTDASGPTLSARDTDFEATPPGSITVTAGNRVVVGAASVAQPAQLEAVTPAEIERRLGWRAPRVEFSGMPLAEAVALLNREAAGRTNVRLHIIDRDLDAMRVSGTFRTDNLDAFVLLLEAGFGVKVERIDDVFVLSKALAP